MSDYRLSDLLDLTIIQKMADSHYRAAGMPIGIIDAIDGSILVGSGWQEICTKFHRVHPVALQRCVESDDYIKDRLVKGEACQYKCKNGLWDIGMPIVVSGEHLATMFLGQFFYEGEAPDREFFKRQAHDLGFNFEDYLAALDAVPVFSREKVDYILEYDKALVSFIADLAEHAGKRRQAEEEKEKLQGQLALAQKMESIGRLAGGVAHDFNNMLSVIIGYSDLILRRMAPEDPSREELEAIYAAAERSRDITRQLLAFARKEVVAPRLLNLNDSLQKTLSMLRPLIGEDIELVWHPGTNLSPVLMDPSQLDHLLTNLCVNARDAIEDVGKIVIETSLATFDTAYCAMHAGFTPGEFVLLSVSDDGCGMDRDMLDKIFEPFFTTKNLGRGTGLGLATVYGIVKQNNGFINVYSEPGEGTTFRIYLSRQEGDISEGSHPATGQASKGNGETILVVEDEVGILKLVKNILTDFNYNVIAANGPSEALQSARAHHGDIALLITDVVMPEMNGRELAEQMKALSPNIKCLYMSGYTANVIAHRGVLDKGFQFIQKPFTPNDFVNKISSVLNEGSGS